MKTLKSLVFALVMVSSTAYAQQPYGPYNQSYTYNTNTNANWMNYFGPGINTAGVMLMNGIVTKMFQPEPKVIYQQVPAQQVGYQGGYQGGNQGGYQRDYPHPMHETQASGNCTQGTYYDRNGNPIYGKLCR